MTPDAAQSLVIDADPAASAVVIGAPGTGKTHTLVERVASLLGDRGFAPEEVLVLTPSRRAATGLRDRIGVRIGVATPGPMARSLASFAFALVRGAMVHTGDEPPSLLTGADQDRIIADLLAGDAADEEAGAVSRWPESLSGALRGSTVFRSELRAFLAACTERGVTTAQLSASPDAGWQAVASFAEEYRDVLALLREPFRDIPDLVREATVLVREAAPAVLGPFAALRVVLIDDAQELTGGGVALVGALRERGIAVMAFGDPDISSGVFRGASAAQFHELAGLLGHAQVLDTPHRQAPALTTLTRTLTQAIGAAGRVEHRRPPGEAVQSNAVRTFLADSSFAEIDRIAQTLREWRLLDGIAWDEMAVIAHDSRQVALLEAELAAREVPTRAAGIQRPLGSEAAVRDIVGVVALALTPVPERSAEALAEALCTPFGGMDAVGLRRLRARLRQRELADGGSSPASELLVRAFAAPAHFALIDAPEARRAERFAATLAAVAEGARAGETVHELLWRVWDRARLAGPWEAAATAPGGAETGRALDSLVALFDAAKRFVERFPDEEAAVFIRDVLDSEIPEDSLSGLVQSGVVTLLTPQSALGTQFEAVVVAGVCDGVWPNLRLRGSLLATWRLYDPDAEVIDRRRQALHDELRLFVRAVSRARSRLVVTAIDDDDHAPSPFFVFLPPPETVSAAEDEPPLTLRALTAHHRRTLTASSDDGARVRAAGQLSLLAQERVPGADPEQWYGVPDPTTLAPIHDLELRAARVSPSQMQNFDDCSLAWAISALGGDRVLPPAAGIGTILHEAMERSPEGDLQRMREIVAELWSELQFDTPWIGRRERRRAEIYVDRMHGYLRAVAAAGGRVVASEADFTFAVNVDDTPAGIVDPDSERPRALVHGYIDRVESYPPGAGEHADARGRGWEPMADLARSRVVVVDLKTGRYEAETDQAASDHAQLAAYQVAVQEGLVAGADPEELAGARLLLVAKTLAKSDFRIAHQHRLDGEARAQFLQRIADAARGMSAADFTAQLDTHCFASSGWTPLCRIHTVPAVSS